MTKTVKAHTLTTKTEKPTTPTDYMFKNLGAPIQEAIQIGPSKHSNGNKEVVASLIDDFLSAHWKVFSDGYSDVHSSMLRDYLASELLNYSWHKNSSQHPFDIYSVDAGVAIENKSHKVGKTSTGFGYKNTLVVNATLYPDEARTRDIVPKKYWKDYDEETLNSFMDILVVTVDKTRTNNIVRYKVVDGNYWGVDYEVFESCSNFFNQLNTSEIKNGLLELLVDKYDNKLAKLLLAGDLPDVKLDLRKLLVVKNPNAKE